MNLEIYFNVLFELYISNKLFFFLQKKALRKQCRYERVLASKKEKRKEKKKRRKLRIAEAKRMIVNQQGMFSFCVN